MTEIKITKEMEEKIIEIAKKVYDTTKTMTTEDLLDGMNLITDIYDINYMTEE